AGDAVYMLQDTFPHFRESESLGVVGRMDVANGFRLDPTLVIADTFWLDDWLYKGAVVGDWADVSYGNVAVTVVMPNLARRFPKEIAVGPDGFRTVFWSGRSGRELDFRTATLINEYWQTFAEAAPEGPMAFAARPSNAAGTGRTHDVWLIPSAPAVDVATVQQRARAAQDIPLVQPD